MAIESYKARVLENRRLNGKFFNLRFLLLGQKTLLIKAGQFIVVKVSDSEFKNYSISRKEFPIFEILVDVSPGGVGSKFLNNLKAGDKINFFGSFGNFYLQDDGSTELIFVATGSGISAVRPMIEELIEKRKRGQIRLYHGLRNEGEIFWQDIFSKLQKENSNFKYTLVLSQSDNDWQGEKGYVQDIIMRDGLKNPQGTSFYLCGNGAMIAEVERLAIKLGVPRDKIYHEKYYENGKK